MCNSEESWKEPLHHHVAGAGDEQGVAKEPPTSQPLRKNVLHDCTSYLDFFKRGEKKINKGKDFKVRFISLKAPPGLK